jgi:hypothetical protein
MKLFINIVPLEIAYYWQLNFRFSKLASVATVRTYEMEVAIHLSKMGC